MSIKLLQKLDEAECGNLTPNEKLVLLALVTSAEKGGNFSWAGINLIRKRTNIEDPTSIRRSIRGLIRKEYLERDQQEGKGKLRNGFKINIPTEKMKNYHEYKELEREQTVLREENKMSSKGVYKLSSINSKDRNSKNRNSKNLLSSTKNKEKGIWNFPIGSNMSSKKKFKNPNKNKGMSVEEIVNQKMKEKPIPKKMNPVRLWEIWCNARRKKDSNYKGLCDGKIVGCLKYIIKHIESADLTPKHFIETIVDDWYGYQQVCKDQDCKSTCLSPSIPYLTQYLESAVLFYIKKWGTKG